MRYQIAAFALVVAATPAAAQRTADFHWDKALPSGSTVSVHDINGDISVKPSTSGKVEVLGYGHGGKSVHAEVHETAHGVVICVVPNDSDSTCDERGLNSHGHWRGDWDRDQMDLEIAIPANTPVTASSVSGDVAVTGAQGEVSANSVSGDVKLDRISGGSVSAHSVSGDVDVSVDALSGSGDLSFKSVSGDITLEFPKTLDADLSMSTVSGEMNSDYPLTLNGRMSRRRMEARIGKGGRDLEISTVSGDVRLRAK